MDAKMDAAVRVMLKERDRQRAIARDNREKLYLYERAGAYADGLDLAISAVAGAYGYGWRESLEAALASPAGSSTPLPSRQQRPFVAAMNAAVVEVGAQLSDAVATAVRQPAPADLAREVVTHGNPDVDAIEPMGGWEPRS